MMDPHAFQHRSLCPCGTSKATMTYRPKKKWGPLKIGCFGVLCIVGIAGLWLVYAVHWALTAVPGGGNAAAVRLDELALSHQPAGEDGTRGFEALTKAISIYSVEESAFRDEYTKEPAPEGWFTNVDYPYDFQNFYREGVPPISLKNTRELLDRLQRGGLPEALTTVAAQPAFTRPFAPSIGDEMLMGLLLPELGKMRALCRYNSARMNWAAKQGDESAYVEAFDSSLSLARAASADPVLISRLVGIAIFAKAAADLRTNLVHRQFKPDTIEALIASIDRHMNWPSFEVCIEGERAFYYDAIQKTYTDDGNGDGRMLAASLVSMGLGYVPGSAPTDISQSLAKHKVSNVVGFFFPSKKETLAKGDVFYDEFVEYVRTPASVRRANPNDKPQLTDQENRKFPVLALMIPAFEKMAFTQSSFETNLAGTKIMLALELYRARHGAAPDSLDQLVPEFLFEIPQDSYTGTPYGYLKLSTPDEFGRHYILYSYGNNIADDGGAFDSKQNYLAEFAADRGLSIDWVLNPPQQPYQPPE